MALVSIITVHAQTILNPSFESPVLVPTTYLATPPLSNWTMAGQAGIAANSSSLGNDPAPAGNQVLFIQTTATAEQTIAIPTAGNYTLKFKAAQPSGFTNSQTFKVLMNGSVINYVTPASKAFVEVILPDIFLPVGNQILKFAGVSPYFAGEYAFIDDITLTKNPTVQTIPNGGFEVPILAASTYQDSPADSGWTFGAGGGIASNGSTLGNATAKEGSQVLFLQGTGSAERTVTFATAGTYRIALKAAQRTSQAQSIKISLGGTVIDTITPSNNQFSDYLTADVTLPAGDAVLRLEGTNPLAGGDTAFVDALTVEQVSAPENWSNPMTWPDKVVPTTGSDVVIPPGKTVILDQNIDMDDITVGGTLRFARQNITVSACAIMADGPAARVEIGTAQNRFTQRAVITLTGGTTCTDHDQIVDGNAFVSMNGGVLDINGADVTSWTRLGATVNVGGNTITLAAAPVGWGVGADIMIASSTSDWNQAETRTITAISGTTVTLNTPLTYMHTGVQQSYSRGGTNPRTWNLDLRAEVGLLTRNITVQGDANALTTGFGGHLMAMKKGGTLAGDVNFLPGGRAYVQGAEFYRMGRKSVVGKYPLHFHMLGQEGKGQFFINNSIHHSNNRAITVHGTESTIVQNNFCYDHIGHGIFLEDGSERFNRIIGNLVALTRRPASLAEAVTPSDFDSTPEAGGPRLQAALPASFWITNPNNIIEDNVAAGTQGTGMWVVFPSKPAGLSATDPRFSSQIPKAEPLGSLTRTVAHSSYCGLEVAGDLTAAHEFTSNTGSYFLGGILVDDATLYANHLGHYGGLSKFDYLITFRNLKIADSTFGLMQANNSLMEESLVVADTGLNLLLPQPFDGLRGPNIERAYDLSYDGPTRARNNHLVGFDAPNASVLGLVGAAHKHTNASLQGFTFSPNVLPRVSLPYNKVNSQPRTWGMTYRDLDGSVTGKANTSIIVDHPFTRTSTDFIPSNWTNAARSDHKFSSTKVIANVSYGPYADTTVIRQKTGEKDVPFYYGREYSAEIGLALIVNEGYNYTYRLHTVPSNKKIIFGMSNVGPGDFVKVRFTSFGSFPGLKFGGGYITGDGQGPTPVSVNTMTALDDATVTSYFINGGDIWVKCFQDIQRENDYTYFNITWTSNGTLAVTDTDGDGVGDQAEVAAGTDPFSVGLGYAFNSPTVVQNPAGWQTSGIDLIQENGDGTLLTRSSGTDPYIYRNVQFNGSYLTQIIVRYKAEASGDIQFYWANENGGFAPNRYLAPTTTTISTADPLYEIAIFNLAGNPEWDGKSISQIRFNTIPGVGVQTWIDVIASGNGDLDGDGVSNIDEALAGRNPDSTADFGFEFNTSQTEGWDAQGADNSFMSGSDFVFRSGGSLYHSGLALKGSELASFSVRFKSEGSRTPRLYWANENGDLSEARAIDANAAYFANSGYKVVTFNLAGHPEWTGKTISALRIDFPSGSGLSTSVDWIDSASARGITSYDMWIAGFPGLANTTANGDPDNDGSNNLLEYVLNRDPGASDASIMPQLDASGSNFVFTFIRRTDSAGETTQVFQYGSTLTEWTDVSIVAGPQVTIGAPVGAVQLVTVTIPKAGQTKLFGRLKVTQP